MKFTFYVISEWELNLYNFLELMDMGSAMHRKIRSHLIGGQTDVSRYKEVENCWISLENVLENVSKPILVEKMVVHNELLYKGIVDCVAFYK